jgi:hypothetical protein
MTVLIPHADKQICSRGGQEPGEKMPLIGPGGSKTFGECGHLIERLFCLPCLGNKFRQIMPSVSSPRRPFAVKWAWKVGLAIAAPFVFLIFLETRNRKAGFGSSPDFFIPDAQPALPDQPGPLHARLVWTQAAEFQTEQKKAAGKRSRIRARRIRSNGCAGAGLWTCAAVASPVARRVPRKVNPSL